MIPTQRNAIAPDKCAQKAWLAFTHTPGIQFQHTRGIILRVVFGTQSTVVISISQSTKHRVTLFRNVVLAQCHSVPRQERQKRRYGCKITYYSPTVQNFRAENAGKKEKDGKIGEKFGRQQRKRRKNLHVTEKIPIFASSEMTIR